MIHINNEILLSMKRNEFESVVVRWMNLEPVIHSEVCQKEKNKYCILMPVCGISKKDTNEPVCKVEIETQA